MKRIILLIALGIFTQSSYSESLADKLKKQLEKATEKINNSQVNTETTGTKDPSKNSLPENPKNQSSCKTFDASNKKIADDFFTSFKALPGINHDEVVQKLIDDPSFGCKKFSWCTLQNYPIEGQFFKAIYQNYVKNGTIGDCPWGGENVDDGVQHSANKVIMDLKWRLEYFQKYSASNPQSQPIKANASASASASESKKKGEKFASESKFKWDLRTEKDEMTRTEKIRAFNLTKISSGSVETFLECKSGDVYANFTFLNLTVPTEKNAYAIVTTRVNDTVLKGDVIQRSGNFKNVFGNYYANIKDGAIVRQNTINGIPLGPEIYEYLYDYAVKFETSAGPFYIEIPPYNSAVNKVLLNCK
jgi:hypothetical protein